MTAAVSGGADDRAQPAIAKPSAATAMTRLRIRALDQHADGLGLGVPQQGLTPRRRHARPGPGLECGPRSGNGAVHILGTRIRCLADLAASGGGGHPEGLAPTRLLPFAGGGTPPPHSQEIVRRGGGTWAAGAVL